MTNAMTFRSKADAEAQAPRLSFEEHFFIIDSDRLNEVSTQLYGYTFVDGQLICGPLQEPISDTGSDGSFVYVVHNDEGIVVSQDFMGCYGLYLYEPEDASGFVLSNSFLYLIEYLSRQGKPFTLNERFAKYFMAAGVCSVAYRETLANEISLLPRNGLVHIDCAAKILRFEEKPRGEEEYAPDSPEGMACIDAWYAKWTRLIRSLVQDGQGEFRSDLSGGFDSRIVLALILGADVDLRDVRFVTLPGTHGAQKEDWRIANLLAKHYGFYLNEEPRRLRKTREHSPAAQKISAAESLALSSYAKMGSHKQLHFEAGRRAHPAAGMSGSGGECLRSYWAFSVEDFIDNEMGRIRHYPTEDQASYLQAVGGVIRDSAEQVRDSFIGEHRRLAPEEIMKKVYLETRCRFHFGRDCVENYLANTVKYLPLMDQDLYRVRASSPQCSDEDLLMAILFDRFAPELLEFPVEGGRSIAGETLAYAREVNGRYPLASEVKTSLGRRNALTELVRKVKRRLKSAKKADGDSYEEAILKRIDCDIRHGATSERLRTDSPFLSDGARQVVIEDAENRKRHPLTNIYSLLIAGYVNYAHGKEGGDFCDYVQRCAAESE